MLDPTVTTDESTESTGTTGTAGATPAPVAETLVEDVSIDGMCGVY
jgi:mycofactocin precursor